jgi:hypothetical protein
MCAPRSGLGDRRRALVPSSLPRIQLRKKLFVADLIEDRRASPPIFHCIVQPEGSVDIVFWGQYTTIDEAKETAEAHLIHLTSRKSQFYRCFSI